MKDGTISDQRIIELLEKLLVLELKKLNVPHSRIAKIVVKKILG